MKGGGGVYIVVVEGKLQVTVDTRDKTGIKSRTKTWFCE